MQTPDSSLYAVEGVSAGFHADARSRYDADNSADMRQGLRALGAALRGYRPYELHGRIDGDAVDDPGAAQLFLSNLPYFGFGFHVAPGADPVHTYTASGAYTAEVVVTHGASGKTSESSVDVVVLRPFRGFDLEIKLEFDHAAKDSLSLEG